MAAFSAPSPPNTIALAARADSAVDGDDARPPGAARCVDLDLVIDLRTDQCSACGGVRRNAADAGGLELNPLTVLVFEFEKNADTNLSHYTGTVSFGPNCTVTVLP